MFSNNQRIEKDLSESWDDMKENTRKTADRVSDWAEEKTYDLRESIDQNSAERTEERARQKDRKAGELHEKAREKASGKKSW